MRRVTALLAIVAATTLATPALADGQGWPDLSTPAAVTAEGAKDAAVIVGIDEYAFVAHVPGAARNASDWLTFLTESRHVPIDHVQLLRNIQGTREGILKATAAAAKQVEAGGTLWFVFIGHGAPAQSGGDGLLVGADAQQTADSIFARSVAQGEVLTRLAASPASAHRILVVDACFSGRAGDGAALADGLQPMLAVHEARVAGATVLSAGASDQFAGPLPGAGRPAFSYLVLGALRGWAAEPNGDVTANDAVSYARLVMRSLPLGRTQEPRVAGAAPGFVLAKHAVEKAPNLHDILLHTGEPGPAPSRPGPSQPSPTAVPPMPAPDEGPRLPGAIHASFSAPLGDTGVWRFEDARHKTLCKLPCTRWMVPAPGYVLVRTSPMRGDSDVRVPVPAETTFKDGADVNEQLIAPRGSLKAGVIVSSISAVAGGVGGYLTYDGFRGQQSIGEGTTGVVLAALGFSGILVGLPMMLSAHDWQVEATPGSQGPIMFHFSPQGLELTHGTTHAVLSSSGVRGVF